jgi:hypothetical protein
MTLRSTSEFRFENLYPAKPFKVFDEGERWLFRIKPYCPTISIVFMHIPKTSGIAFGSGLATAVAPQSVVHGIDRTLFGVFDAFDSMDPELRRLIYLEPNDLPSGADFVHGHISFTALKQSYQTAQYITVLREPISRVLSHWLHWRTQSEDELRQWGDWAKRVSIARGPLIDFLSCPDIACQTDNLYVRMLLCPHRLIPNNDFIDEGNDNALVDEAITRLEQFAYIDVIENPNLKENIQIWLGRPFRYSLVNERQSIRSPFRTPLHQELKPEVFDRLELRTRLDLKLWMTMVRERVSPLNPELVRIRTVMLNASRYAWLMAPDTGPLDAPSHSRHEG